MSLKPYMTSDDLIVSIKRRAAVPVDQITFTNEDLLAFANEEMFISQVPSILQFHEEYFVEIAIVPLEANKSEYDVPNRAIGMRLRDIYYSDGTLIPGKPYGNLVEMTRIGLDDVAFFDNNSNTSNGYNKFYMRGNKIALAPTVGPSPTGMLVIFYYMRPNQLVPNERGAFIQKFVKTISIDNGNLVPNDTITICSKTFTAVSGTPSTDQFQIGINSIVTASNLVSLINVSGLTAVANNGSPSTSTIEVDFNNVTMPLSSDSSGMVISSLTGLRVDAVPSHFAVNSKFDFLQTLPGHRTKNFDVVLKNISSNILFFDEDDVPTNLVLEDNVCSANESIIPQLPPDLHTGLAERAAARLLSSLGDNDALQTSNAKLQEIEQRQGTLLDNRVDGAPLKVNSKGGILGYTKRRRRSRL